MERDEKQPPAAGAQAQTGMDLQEPAAAPNDHQKTPTSHEYPLTEHNTNKEVTDGSASSASIENETPIAPPTDVPSPEAEPEASRTRFQTVIIMSSLCASVFLAALDITIVTTAIPTISEHFESSAGYTWIGSAYLLATAASVPSWGKISDIWGRKPTLLISAGIFFVGSLLAGSSVSIGMLIAARAIQGAGGGGLIILVNISITDLFSMRNRGSYYGLVGMVWALASAIGPILGGVFTSYASWRWCFYINLPITGTVAILLYFFLHLHNPKTPVWEGLKAIDWAGSVLVVGGTLLLLLGLEFGGVIYPWKSAVVICLIIFGVVVSGLFILNEWKVARYPLMPLRLFKYRNNVASFGVCFCHGFSFISGTFFLPLYFQSVLDATPLQSGIYLIPFALSLSLVSGVTGTYIKSTGRYQDPIWAGLAIMLLGMGLFIDLPPDRNWTKIIVYQIVAGIGVGPHFQAPLIALQTMVKPRDIAAATATFGFLRNLSTAVSVVIGGVVFQNEMGKRYASLVTALGPETAGRLSGGSAPASVGLIGSLPPEQKHIAQMAFWESLRTMWILYVASSALGLFFSLFIGKQELSKVHKETRTGLAEEELNRLEEVERKRAKREKALAVNKEEV